MSSRPVPKKLLFLSGGFKKWSKKCKSIEFIFPAGDNLFIGSYFTYKFNGVELIGFLYSGIIFLTVLIATTVMLFRQKSKGTNENKQA